MSFAPKESKVSFDQLAWEVKGRNTGGDVRVSAPISIVPTSATVVFAASVVIPSWIGGVEEVLNSSLLVCRSIEPVREATTTACFVFAAVRAGVATVKFYCFFSNGEGVIIWKLGSSYRRYPPMHLVRNVEIILLRKGVLTYGQEAGKAGLKTPVLNLVPSGHIPFFSPVCGMRLTPLSPEATNMETP